MLRAVATLTLPEQIHRYNSVLDTYGRGAGIGFFDQVVIVFVEHLMQLQQPVEARRAVDRARRTLRVEPHSQLDGEFTKLTQQLKLGTGDRSGGR